MKQSINFYLFERAFHAMDRTLSFSYDAKKVLFEYFEQLEEDTGEEIELDVIAICCDYSEYTEEELTNEYGADNTFDNLSEELKERVIGWTDNTVILINN